MLVNDCMMRHPILITPETHAAEAQKILSENKIRHLPVVGDGKRLKGLISRQRLSFKPDELGSLNIWEITRKLSGLKVKDVMVKPADIHTIEADRAIERAASIMTANKIGCLPVLEDDVVVGIITETDLLNAFQEMLGLPAEGVRVTVRMPEDEKFINLAAVIVEQGWGIMGIGSFPSSRHPGFWDVVLKIPRVTPEQVKEALSRLERQKVVDIRESV
ncbi:CBS domain-containing protein [Chloroflexota bacterium]